MSRIKRGELPRVGQPVLRWYVCRNFWRELARLLRRERPVEAGALFDRIAHEDRAIREGADSRFAVPSSSAWLGLSTLVLAAYRVLGEAIGDPARARALIVEALTAPTRRRIKPYLQLRFGISQRHPERAFDAVSRTMKSRGEALFGDYWLYDDEERNAEQTVVAVRRCLFTDFLRANGAPELAPVFCALDWVWAEELADPRYGITFGRATTLAEGAPACPFQFARATSADTRNQGR